jgi:two-component system, NtrC family, response regulator HydG
MNRKALIMLTHINKILVVDDEVELAHAMAIHLSRSGFALSSVYTFKAAKETIQQAERDKEVFDLVIADISLPGSSGIELLQWIQKTHPQISIILITGFGTDDLIAGNIRPQLDNYCKKPFNPKTLLSKISAIEQGRRIRLADCEV